MHKSRVGFVAGSKLSKLERLLDQLEKKQRKLQSRVQAIDTDQEQSDYSRQVTFN